MGSAANAARRFTRVGIVLALATALVTAIALGRGPLADGLEHTVSAWLNAFAKGLGSAGALEGWRLYPVALAGGLLASLSPCILGMLPVNLSYVGAIGVGSKRRAALVAGSFVAGVVVVNAVLGLASSLFFAVFVEYRGFVNLGVGAVTVLMGLWMLRLIVLPVPSAATMPAGAGPFAMGLIFALVASPCASPVLVAVLAAATKDGSAVRGIMAMVSYSIGYTAVLFLASLFAGVGMASRRFLANGELITRVASVTLVAFGAGTMLYGAYLLR